MFPKTPDRAFTSHGRMSWWLILVVFCLTQVAAVQADETQCDLSKMNEEVQQTEAFFWHVYHGAEYTSTAALRGALSNILEDKQDLTICELALMSREQACSTCVSCRFFACHEHGQTTSSPKLTMFGLATFHKNEQ